MGPLLLLTDRSQLPSDRDLVTQVRRALEAAAAGACDVVLRERDLPEAERWGLVRALAPVVHAGGGRLLVATPAPTHPDLLALVDGAHRRAADPARGQAPRPGRWLDGRSCHSAAELRRAVADGADLVTLSPFALTASKPGYGPALGEEGLRRILDQVDRGRTRAYALGGVTASTAARAVAAGADGVAVMGAVMRAGDPADVIRDLLEGSAQT